MATEMQTRFGKVLKVTREELVELLAKHGIELDEEAKAI